MWSSELSEGIQAGSSGWCEPDNLREESLDASHCYLTTAPDALEQIDFKIQIPYECMITKTIEYKLRQVPLYARKEELNRLMALFGLSQVIVVGMDA
jgi:hypothetical protein